MCGVGCMHSGLCALHRWRTVWLGTPVRYAGTGHGIAGHYHMLCQYTTWHSTALLHPICEYTGHGMAQGCQYTGHGPFEPVCGAALSSLAARVAPGTSIR
eukprot:3261580-Rhodomonas_salina.1